MSINSEKVLICQKCFKTKNLFEMLEEKAEALEMFLELPLGVFQISF